MKNDRFGFRCFDTDIQKFIVGFRLCDHYKWPNGIIEQCTGLKDKNGLLIYEGDIVKITGDVLTIDPKYMDRLFKVIWADIGFCFEMLNENDGLGFCECWEYEIVGNLHENPELLERKKWE